MTDANVSEPQRPEYIAEITRLILRIHIIEGLEHIFKHWSTEATGKLLRLLNATCDESVWEYLSEHEIKVLKQHLRRLGETFETLERAMVQSQLIPETEKAIETVKTSVEVIETFIDLGRPSRQVGSIYHYTAISRDKQGNLVLHPKVQGERDPDNPNHWYWGLSYIVWEGEQWRDRTKSIPRKALSQVQEMVNKRTPIQETLKYIDSLRKSPRCHLTKDTETD